MRDYKAEDKRKLEKYDRMYGYVVKDISVPFKEKLKEEGIVYSAWLTDAIVKYLYNK